MTLSNVQEYLNVIKDNKTNPIKADKERGNLYYDFIVHVSESDDAELSEMAKAILISTEKNWYN